MEHKVNVVLTLGLIESNYRPLKHGVGDGTKMGGLIHTTVPANCHGAGVSPRLDYPFPLLILSGGSLGQNGMHRIQYLGVFPGARSPVTFEEIHTRKSAALEQFCQLFRAIFEPGGCVAVKLCLNTHTTRPWKGAIALSRFMSVKKEHYSIDNHPEPGTISQTEGQFELHYYRLCGVYLDKAVTHLNSKILCTELVLILEKEARENKYLSAYVLVALNLKDDNIVSHISFSEIDLFFSQFPSVKVGKLDINQIKEHHQRLFPEASSVG